MELSISKTPTGIIGFDDITFGGLPSGRSTLICGNAGSGKTLFGLQFIVNGIKKFNENGVVISFEESEKDLCENVASFGWDLQKYMDEGNLVLDYIYIERSEIQETGNFNMDGLLIRIEAALKQVNAKRILIDTLESLFSGFAQENILRAEIRRIFRWLKEKDITAVITAEKGSGTLTRFGLEEYLSDCVISVDNRVSENLCKRRLQILKYRGTNHGTNEYPFIFNKDGYSILPITAVNLEFQVSTERFSTGIEKLDEMFEGEGLYRGSSILISGTAGTGKSTLSGTILDAACKRKEKSMYISFEESPAQLKRDMKSIGLDMEKWEQQGLLRFHSMRSTNFGLETHLSMLTNIVEEFEPQYVVLDPISNLNQISMGRESSNAVTLLIDILKGKKITNIFTELAHTDNLEATETEISSMMDTWILLRDIEFYGERNKGIYILKSRGMKHSNQIREYEISSDGIKLTDVYVGDEGVLTGTARLIQERKEDTEKGKLKRKIKILKGELTRQQEIFDSKITTLKAEFDSEKERILNLLAENDDEMSLIEESKKVVEKSRKN